MNDGLVWDPSLDPTVREVLYALEDEAYVEEDLGDDFFANLQSEEPTLVEEEEVEEEEGEDWMREFKKYRETTANNSDDDTDPMDKRATLTQFSMTSSAMFRNKHLTLLDDQFDRLMMKEYSGSEDEEEEQPELTDTAIQEVLDEFLEKMQVKGKRVIPRLSPSEQIKMIRDGMSHGLSKEELKKMIQETYERQEAEYDSQEEWTEPEDPEKEFWDCQTIISTYSNIYNHPTLLEAPKKIQFNKKGFPVVDESNEEDESEVEDLLPRGTHGTRLMV
jgi:protein LTV1